MIMLIVMVIVIMVAMMAIMMAMIVTIMRPIKADDTTHLRAEGTGEHVALPHDVLAALPLHQPLPQPHLPHVVAGEGQGVHLWGSLARGHPATVEVRRSRRMVRALYSQLP